MVLIEDVVDGGWGRADETVTIEKMQQQARSAAASVLTQSRDE